MENTSSEKIADALKLLEEAATQKKDELKSVMADKYMQLRNVIVETESSLDDNVPQLHVFIGHDALQLILLLRRRLLKKI